MTPPPEPAPEHVRNALMLVSLALETAERRSSAEGPCALVPVATLDAIRSRLEAALNQLEGGTEP